MTRTLENARGVVYKEEWILKPLNPVKQQTIKLTTYQKLIIKLWAMYIRIRR